MAKQWCTSVQNLSGVDDRIFKVFAICARGSNATVEATEFTVGDGEHGEGFATCGGRRVLGGGVIQKGSAGGVRLSASGPLDASGTTVGTSDGDVARHWYASVSNGGAEDATLKVFAICV